MKQFIALIPSYEIQILQVSFFTQSLPIFSQHGSNFTTCSFVTSKDTDLPCVQLNHCLISLSVFKDKTPICATKLNASTHISLMSFLDILYCCFYQIFHLCKDLKLAFSSLFLSIIFLIYFSLIFVQSAFISLLQHSATMKDFSTLSEQENKCSFHISSCVLYHLPEIPKQLSSQIQQFCKL